MAHSREWLEGAIAACTKIHADAQFHSADREAIEEQWNKYEDELAALPPSPPAPDWALVEETESALKAMMNGWYYAKSSNFANQDAMGLALLRATAALDRIEKARK
jgi:hypothetical protein